MIEDEPTSQEGLTIVMIVINATCSVPSNHGGRTWTVDKVDSSGMSGSVAAIEESLTGIASTIEIAHQATGCNQPLRLTLQACPKIGEIIKYER